MDYAKQEKMLNYAKHAFKTLCLTKSKTMKGLVSDEELKNILQQDVDTSTKQLQEFASILSKAKPN